MGVVLLVKKSPASADAVCVSVKGKKEEKKNSLELDVSWRWWQNVSAAVRLLTRKDTCPGAVYPKSLTQLPPVQELGIFQCEFHLSGPYADL